MQKVKLPDVYEREINAIIDAGCYVNESEVINDALKILFASKPNLKLAAAIEMYKKSLCLAVWQKAKGKGAIPK